MTFLTVPRLLVAFCLVVSTFAFAQANESHQCKEIGVNAKTSLQADGNFKVTLEFSDAGDYRDFSMNLFAENRDNNKLEFSALEIKDLSKGNYLLVIQSKGDSDYCAKQLKLKLR